MNKRLKKKFVKRLLNNNLDTKIYGEEIYQDRCKNCKDKYEVTSGEEYYSCDMECDTLPKWFEYKFDNKDIDKLMLELIGKIPLEALEKEVIHNFFKLAKWYLLDFYGIKGYEFVFGEDNIEVENKLYDYQLKIFGEADKYIIKNKPYFIIRKTLN